MVKLMRRVIVSLPEKYVNDLDYLVRGKYYPSRSDAIRSAVRDLLLKEVWNERPN